MRLSGTVRLFTLLAISTTALASCGSTSSSSTSSSASSSVSSGSSSSTQTSGSSTLDIPSDAHITMLTDVGTIDDKSFNQGTWEGVEAWAQANGFTEGTTGGMTYNYLRPSAGDTASYEETIEDAIDAGATVIVSPGYLFQEAFEAETVANPDVKFIGIDFTQTNIASATNAVNIVFKEQDAGFLAGYAAAEEGLTNLGFVGGMQIPAVYRYGSGFAAGIAYANYTDGKSAQFTASHVYYAGAFTESPTYETTPSGWLANDGVDGIFGAAGQVNNNVFNVVESYHETHTDLDGKAPWAIGVDVDQYNESEYVLTSAMKGLGVAVQDALDNVFSGFSYGGTSITLGAKQDAAGIPTADDSWRFSNFTKDQYNAVLEKIENDDASVKIPQVFDDNGADLASILTGYGVDEDVASALVAVLLPQSD